MDLGQLGHQARVLRQLAEECRDEAAALRHRAHAIEWDGVTAAAFRSAVTGHVHALHATAVELEVAATALEAHELASAAARSALGAGVDVVGAGIHAVGSAIDAVA
ncbi:MAG: hypothetical protein QM572_18395 [Nocardioides sp.]|uniref:hypothetical protein n=1 Tax=Nocardioides sp. TaxID=35761 RepID=UPI0039E521BC